MRPIQEPGFAPLSEMETQDMLNQHIPYRIRLLLDASPRLPSRCDPDNQAFEAGTVSGRILLGFIGLRYDEKTRQLKPERENRINQAGLTDDVTVRDVGGTFVELTTLSATEAETLGKFIHGAHKACAHFTMGSGHRLDVPTYQQAVPIILRLLRECLPNKVGHG